MHLSFAKYIPLRPVSKVFSHHIEIKHEKHQYQPTDFTYSDLFKYQICNFYKITNYFFVIFLCKSTIPSMLQN